MTESIACRDGTVCSDGGRGAGDAACATSWHLTPLEHAVVDRTVGEAAAHRQPGMAGADDDTGGAGGARSRVPHSNLRVLWVPETRSCLVTLRFGVR